MAERFIVDGDAYVPPPIGYYKHRGRDHGILSVQDVDQITLQKVREFDRNLEAIRDPQEQVAFVRGIIVKLVPSLPESELVDESPNKLLWMLGRILAGPAEATDSPLATGQTA